jgi:hypothetical protein
LLLRTSVLEAAEARGLATGLVTSHVTDATPPPSARNAEPHDREGIAAQYAAADIEVRCRRRFGVLERRRDGRSRCTSCASATPCHPPAER